MITDQTRKRRIDFPTISGFGDFFGDVPPNADVYILKRVLHDWGDERAISILTNCRRAMPRESRILVIDSLIGSPNEPSRGKLQDLSMLIMTGGKERSEFENLFLDPDCD